MTSAPAFGSTYEWHTFYGQLQNDEGKAIAVDGSGNIYIAGFTFTSVQPGTWNGPAGQPPLHPYSGNSDIMVMKLNSKGEYQWHTFYGDGDRQWANGIAVDGSGNVYVTGFTDGAQWLGDGNTPPVRYGQSDGAHIVVLKLDTNGAYQWHTFYGYWVDEGDAIAVDGSGDVYITGYSAGTSGGAWLDMPAPLHAHSGSGYDTTILKLNSNGAYQWHTFYGAGSDDGYDEGHGIAVDANGNVYVTGESSMAWGTPLHAHTGSGSAGKPDIFVLKLDSSGAYQWHTFYGATYADPYWAVGEKGYGIAVDGSGNAYVTGESCATWGTPLHAYSGGRDITVLKLDTNGVYQWHTFYGSTGNNYGNAIAVNENGSVFIAGDGYTTWLGDGGAQPDHPHSNSRNMAVLKLDINGFYQWHTFYGAGSDFGYGIASDPKGDVYVTGAGGSNWLGDGDTAPLHAYSGSQGYGDITVLKLADTLPVGSLSVTISPQTAIDAGAQWKVDTGTWQASGSTVQNLSVGSHTLTFKDVSGWTTPTVQNVPITSGKTATATGIYVQQSSVDFTATPTSGKAPLTVKFTDKSTGSIKGWLWDFGDGRTSTSQNPSYTYSRPGTYTVKLTVTRADGTKNAKTQTNLISVYVAPKADFTATPTKGKTPLTVKFTDKSTGGATSWSWSFGDGQTGKDRNPSHTYTKAGKYTVTLTTANPVGTNTKRKTSFIVVSEPPPVADFSADNLSGKIPLKVTFTDKSTGNVTRWSWKFGDGRTSSSKNPVYTYNKAGSYTVMLTVIGAGGSNTMTKTKYITATQ